jgi:hypothetical protein
MSADGGSEYDEDQPDQEEIIIDNEIDAGDDHMMEEGDHEGGRDQQRLKINQVGV